MILLITYVDTVTKTTEVMNVKNKEKEASFNVAYDVTYNNSSRAILQHRNIFNRYLPALLNLSSTIVFMRASARDLLVPLLHLCYGAETEAAALPTELSRLS